MPEMYYLPSVGCFIDTDGYTYSALKDNTPDISDKTIMTREAVQDCHDALDWYNELSPIDKAIVDAIIK